MEYKHKNVKKGIIKIYDSNGEGYVLKPGDEITIDRKQEGNGIIILEEIKKDKKSKKEKYNEEDIENDNSI